jgi:hypothetical protein
MSQYNFQKTEKQSMVQHPVTQPLSAATQ